MSKTKTLTDHNIKTIVYSDFFTDFSKNSATGQLNKKTNENAVKQSIRNLLLTDHYERPFRPTLGSNLRSMLFENFGQTTALRAKEYIKETIEQYEPRADLIKTDVGIKFDTNSLLISIYFRIINTIKPARLDINIERSR